MYFWSLFYMWAFMRNSCTSFHWRQEIGIDVGVDVWAVMTVGYPLPELSSFLKCRLFYKLVERRGYFSRHADVQDSKIALHQQKNKKVSKTQQALMTCSIKGSDGMGCNKYLHCAWLVSDPQLFATVGWNSQLPSLVQASSASARLFCSIGRQ